MQKFLISSLKFILFLQKFSSIFSIWFQANNLAIFTEYKINNDVQDMKNAAKRESIENSAPITSSHAPSLFRNASKFKNCYLNLIFNGTGAMLD